MKNMKVWVVTGKSESGDDYGPLAFIKKPTDKALKEICFGWDGNDEADGPGEYGSYVHLSVEHVTVQK